MQLCVDKGIDGHPDDDVREPEESECKPGLRDAKINVEKGNGRHAEGSVCGTEQRFNTWLDKRRQSDSPFPDSQPTHTTSNIFTHRHSSHRLDCQISEDQTVVVVLLPLLLPRYFPAPEEIADQMVFADVFGEKVDA